MEKKNQMEQLIKVGFYSNSTTKPAKRIWHSFRSMEPEDHCAREVLSLELG